MVRRSHERIHEDESFTEPEINRYPEDETPQIEEPQIVQIEPVQEELGAYEEETPEQEESSSHARRDIRRYSTKRMEQMSAYDQVITTIENPNSLVVSLSDPDIIIPHEKIPADIKKAVIETYGDEYFHSIDWSASRLKRLAKALRSPRHNTNNVAAQICGPICSFKDECPYDIAGRAPIGERCPIELDYSKRLYDDYVRAVSDRLNMDEAEIKENIILNNHINSLVVNEMVERRMDSLIARDGVSEDIPVFMDEESGKVFCRKDESTAVKIKARLSKKTDAILRQLLATPEMAEKYRNKKSTDVLSRTSEILDNLDKKMALMIESKTSDATIIESEKDSNAK